MPDTPLRPDELDDYRTEVQTTEVMADDARTPPDEDQHPWVLVGMVLLGVFVVVLVLGILAVVG